jgi:carbonic anhydrase
MASIATPAPTRRRAHRFFIRLALSGLCAAPLPALAQAHGNDHAPKAAAAAPAAPAAAAPAAPAPTAKDIGQQVRQALAAGVTRDKELVVGTAGGGAAAAVPVNPKASRQYIRARAAALAARKEPIEEIIEPAHAAGEVHWDYAGVNGPAAWGSLKPEFATCATGKRQSPINIDDSITLRGPAEAIVFDYNTSSATVVNNGHTIQIDVTGDNGIIVRGSRYQLLQLHFHHPSEERINYRSFAMVAHLVHKDYLGRLAVVAVLLEPGPANPVINNFWTYMPLGPGDRVAMPMRSVDLAGLLPKDQRYYQFMGSLTTPPCTEDVLWMILKQPVTLSHEQMRLFAQQFPNNARPVQAINGRVVRDAQ